MEFDQITRSITFPATINMDEGMLEYTLVTEAGKVHESLLTTKAHPIDLNLAILLLRFQPAQNFFRAELLPPDKKPAPGAKPSALTESNSFDIMVSWKDKDGKAQTAFVEEWIRNDAKKENAKRAPWAYTGSEFDKSTGTFAAQMNGSIIALFADSLALVNNPREGSDSDEIWLVGENIPPLKSEVLVTLKPHQKPKHEESK